MIQEQQKRDYDKNPIIISNNYISIIYGVIFWLIVHLFLVYLFIYGNVIDWTHNENWYIVLKEEAEKSFRFSGVLIMILITNILAIRTLYKALKSPKKIIFSNNFIKSNKNFNDLEFLELKEIKDIKKGYFPLLLTEYKKIELSSIIGILVTFPFLFIMCLISVFFELLTKNRIYFVVFSNSANRVININISLPKDYLELREYFLYQSNIDLNHLKNNYKLLNI